MRACFVEIPHDVVERETENGNGVEVFVGHWIDLNSVVHVVVYPDDDLSYGMYKAMVIFGGEENHLLLSQAQYAVLSKELGKATLFYAHTSPVSPQLPNLPVDLPAVSQLEERYKNRKNKDFEYGVLYDADSQEVANMISYLHKPSGFYED